MQTRILANGSKAKRKAMVYILGKIKTNLRVSGSRI